MPAHSALTGSDLHEPKGASGASQHTVYVADGAGSGTWQKITADSVDTSVVLDLNTGFVTVTIADVSTASTVYIPCARAITINKVVSVLTGTITGADAIITVKNAAGASMGTLTIAQSGSAAGNIDTLLPSSNNTVAEDSYFTIETDGASTNAVPLVLQVEYTITS